MAATVYTLEQVVAMVTALDPVEAAQSTNGTLVQLCSTPLVEAVTLNGRTIPLATKDGKYTACYVRVSSEQQRSRNADRRNRKSQRADHADGYSEHDQVSRMVYHCAETKS